MSSPTKFDAWQALPDRPLPPPAADEIHLYLVALNEDEAGAAPFADVLSAGELARADRLISPIHRARFISARGWLRLLLSRYISIPAHKIMFQVTPSGKPHLAQAPSLPFNLSHSGHLALFAFGKERRLGVDLEWHDPGLDRELLASQSFSPREAAELSDLPPAERLRPFFDCWTRKEAFVKALGAGLACPLDAFDVAFLPGRAPALTRLELAGERASDWELLNIPVPGAWSAALASDKPVLITQRFVSRAAFSAPC